jgi:aminopeptidase-like protein
MDYKKLFKGLALGVMFALTTTAFAGEGEGEKTNSTVSILPYLNTDYSIVSLNNTSAKNTLFTIEDASGEVFYKEWIDKSGFSQKVLDFSYLSDGKYDIVLRTKGSESIKESFTVKNHKVVSDLKKDVAVTQRKSFVNIIDNMLYVSHLSSAGNSFGVSILDADADEVYSETFEGYTTFSKKFDVSALPSGSYEVSINAEKKEFSYAFTK